jgi:anti-anti-sigma factor
VSLNLEVSKAGEPAVIHCRSRIIYREEAATLSNAVSDALRHSKNVVLDLEGTSDIDSCGLGELVALHMWAQGTGGTLKLSGLSSRVHYLLELTNLTSVLEIYSTPEAALDACQPQTI